MQPKAAVVEYTEGTGDAGGQNEGHGGENEGNGGANEAMGLMQGTVLLGKATSFDMRHLGQSRSRGGCNPRQWAITHQGAMD